MTTSQRRMLYRLLAVHDIKGKEATLVLREAADVSSTKLITKTEATRLINVWLVARPLGSLSEGGDP